MPQELPEKASQHAPLAAKLFAGFVTRRESVTPQDFEALCTAHPDTADELRVLHGHWQKVLAVLEQLDVSSSLARSAPVPDVSTAERTTIDVLRRLAGRRNAASRYSIQGEVARGGMGAILRVWDEDLRRNLAMKVVLGQTDARPSGGTPAVDSAVLGRFLEEAQITSQLEHPGIVPVHELGLDADGRVFFTMRLVSGRDLSKIFELVRDGQEGWTQTRAVGVVLKICEAMAYAHDKGVLHRDLKPANVMVGRFGEVYVMDWGLARVLGAETTPDDRPRPQKKTGSVISTDRLDLRQSGSVSALQTMDGDIVGTPAYMSPEQARGALSTIGAAADVFSTGAILYHLLAGHMPYAPDGAKPTMIEIWEKARKEGPETIHERAPNAPAELLAICEKAMAREVSERYAGMLELAEDLRAYLEGRVVRAYETGAVAEFKKWVARNKGLAVTASASLFVILAGTTSAALVLAGKNEELGIANRASQVSEGLARQSAAIADERATRILRLSDVKRLQELDGQAGTLWPAHTEKIPALEAWLAQARELLARLPDHRAALELLRGRALVPAVAEVVTSAAWSFASTEDRWQHDTQAELVAGLESFADSSNGRIAEVEQRLEFARTVEARSIGGDEPRALWDQAVRSIADPGETPFYGGLAIRPQLGLLPLGRDPASGLWEFAHLQTGEVPPRDPVTGELLLSEESGVVFVLIPGGTFEMGAQADDPDEANYDPGAEQDEAPVHSVALAAFLLSKYELTQGQWLRFTGRNPSVYGVGTDFGGHRVSQLHPVEQVSWQECTEVLERLSLQLPTEAQWEYAARAGLTTPWSTGAERESLEGACNLADRAAKRIKVTWPAIEDWPELDDGFAVHAPVDRFRPNAFGLHNVHGNVWEWCRDSFGGYDLALGPEDGERLGGSPVHRVSRGGSFVHAASHARSSNRNNSAPDVRINHLGLRPARALDP